MCTKKDIRKWIARAIASKKTNTYTCNDEKYSLTYFAEVGSSYLIVEEFGIIRYMNNCAFNSYGSATLTWNDCNNIPDEWIKLVRDIENS